MKNKVVYLVAIIILTIMLIVLTGCANNETTGENNLNTEVNAEIVNVEDDGLKLNDELEGVYAFANKTDGNSNTSIVALKDDNSEVQLINSSTIYDCLDYSYGKLYLQEGKEFFYVDLTSGNGNYKVESFYKVESVADWQQKRMQVYDGELYFNKGEQQLTRYNINTKTEEIIESVVSRGNMVDFRIDKKNGTMYYCKSMGRDGISVFGTYTIETKEKKEIFTEDRNGGKGYELLLGNLTNNGVVLYKFSNYDGTIGYEYNKATGELVKIEDGDMVWNKDLYDENKLYYSVMKSEEVLVTYTLKVKQNGEIKDVLSTGEDSVDKVYNLNDKQIEVVTSGGQDISTYHTETFLINKETLEVTETNTTYDNVVHIVEGSDKYTEVSVNENAVVSEFKKEDIIGQWRVSATNNPDYAYDFLYGSVIRYANTLEFKEDGTYEMNIGAAYAETGNYEIQGDRIKLTNINSISDNPDVGTRETEAELKLKKVDGVVQVIIEEKQDEYKAGKVVDTLTIDVILKKK